jgi:hypothetical protein
MRRHRARAAVAIAFALACASSAAAAASETTVAVLGIEPVEVPEGLAQQLTDGLRQRVAAMPGIRQVQGKDLVEMKMVFGCDGEAPACLTQAGRSLGADKLLYGALRKQNGGRSVVVSLKLLDVHTATIEKSVNEVVSRRDLGPGGMTTLAGRWLAQLIEGRVAAVLNVTSDPTGAALAVDGQPVGRTPISLRELSPGTHTLAVSLTGRTTVTRTVELRAGAVSDVAVALEPERRAEVTPKLTPPPTGVVEPPPVALTPTSRAPHPGRPAKIVALAATAGAVVAGAVAIYTWRQYDDTYKKKAYGDLSDVSAAVGGPTDATQGWFKSPTCTPPPSLATAPHIEAFKTDCHSGEAYAAASTALWVVAGALVVGGVVSFVIGDHLDTKAKEARESHSAARLLQQSLRLSPVFSKQGGGLQASFEF